LYFRKLSSHRALIAGIALLAVLLRAAIPMGFMPAGHGQMLMICHDGMLTQHSHYEHCPFGTGSAPAPTPSLAVITLVTFIERLRSHCVEPVVAAVKLVYLPQSRGPPALL
jgi:hypothetical protein